MQIKQLQQDIELLKQQNSKLQEELSYEKDERIKLSALVCSIVEKMRENGMNILEEKVEIVETIVDEEETLPPQDEESDEEYIPDEKTPKPENYKSLTPSPYTEEQEKTMRSMEKIVGMEEFALESKTSEQLIEQTEKYVKMATMVDSLEDLSDNEDFDESVDLALTPPNNNQTEPSLSLTFTPEEKPLTYSQLPSTIVDEPSIPPTIPEDEPTPVQEPTPEPVEEKDTMEELVSIKPSVENTLVVEDSLIVEDTLVIDTTEPPLPSNLRKSPMTPPPQEEDEEVKEEKPVENVNYSKMKVAELKKLCKERKIKGYSKMKKKELVELLEQ